MHRVWQAEARRRKAEAHKALNQQAYQALVPVFHRVAGVKPIALQVLAANPSDCSPLVHGVTRLTRLLRAQGEQRRVAQRFQNRLELRMILMDLHGLRMIGPGQYKSMGTGGLKNEEVWASLTHDKIL